MASPCTWIFLPSFSDYLGFNTALNQLLKINDFEFAKYDFESQCIKKYSTVDNKWTKWIKLNDFNIGEFDNPSFALNEYQLFVYTNKKLIEINQINTNFQTYKIYDCNNCVEHAALIMINNKLHLVGGLRNNKHFIWNEQQSQFDFKYTMETTSVICHRLIYLKFKNILLCMGGIGPADTADTIHAFDFRLNKWSKMKQKSHNFIFGCITTRNDEYIILFSRFDYKIYVLNTTKMKC
eukprot:290982_1